MMKQHHKLTVVLCLVWAATILYGEMFAFWVPSMWSCSWPHLKMDQPQDVKQFMRVAVIADPQLMDKTSLPLPPKSLVLELVQFYTDLNMRRSFYQSILPFKPDVILFLGDYFDGGPFLSNKEWQESLNRFKHTFGLSAGGKIEGIPAHFIPGNHDIGYSRIHSQKPEVVERYEKEFGIRNNRFVIGNVEFIALDAQSLDGQPRNRLSSMTWEFVRNVTLDSQSNPRVLLTHIPLYRPDRTYCGPHRSSSIIDQRLWRAPNGKEVIYQNYVTEESSNKLLDLIKPGLVLSGHDHDQCTVTHESKSGPIEEQTLGTISWQQGNLYPSFMLLSALNSASPNASEKAVLTQLCFLPKQTHIYIWYICLLLLTLLSLLFWPKKGVSYLNHFSELVDGFLSFLRSGAKEKDEDENCEYEMVWDAEGSMHLVKKVVNNSVKRPNDKGVLERGSAVMRPAARKNANEEIEILTDTGTITNDSTMKLSTRTRKSMSKLVVHRLIRTVKMVTVIAALNFPIYMMLLFKDWID